MGDYKNSLDVHPHSIGTERRGEMWDDLLKGGNFVPQTLLLKDIDEDFKRFVEKELVITSPDGKEFPTMVLYSNQRFSEYTQSWQNTDQNNNLLLNFKSITRENNPNYGKIQNGYWNIPGENRFYLMKRKVVLDDNGTESLLDIKMRQPMAIDLIYKVSIFTTNYESINEFNTLINRKFEARQCYIKPNEHFVPMTLENISDESQYNINDRQFYGQTYQIKVMGYIITADDYKVEEVPLKRGLNIGMMKRKKKVADVEINECEEPYNPLYPKPVTLTITFPIDCLKSEVEFTIDTDFKSEKVELENILPDYKVYVNDELIDNKFGLSTKSGDEIKVIVRKRSYSDKTKVTKITFIGYNPSVIYNEELDYPESDLDITQTADEIDVTLDEEGNNV